MLPGVAENDVQLGPEPLASARPGRHLTEHDPPVDAVQVDARERQADGLGDPLRCVNDLREVLRHGDGRVEREAIRAELIKAEAEKQAALAELTSTEAKLASLDAEKAEVIKKAKEEAEAEKQNIAHQTESEIGKIRQQAESEINRLTQQVKAELRRFSAQESVRLAEEKLRAQIDSKSDAALVESGIQSMGGLK